MGLLDDAIREHLDLKRKHGASDEELRRQETEALGPARRDFTPADSPVGEPAAAPVPSDDAAGEYAATPAEPAAWLDDEPSGVAPFDAQAPAEPLEHAAEAADPAAAQEPLPAPDPVPAARTDPAADEPFADPPPRRTSDTPTQGFDALSVEDEPPEDGGEDVLEETPDFLQETPEHDRLWFEQKPPRDFDFDD